MYQVYYKNENQRSCRAEGGDCEVSFAATSRSSQGSGCEAIIPEKEPREQEDSPPGVPEREHRTVPPETDSETSKYCRLTGPPNQTHSQTDQPNRG